jgi:ParB/RepB/Spo0J family partition protein
MSTMEIQTPEIEIDKIDIGPRFNSRKHFDPVQLQAMAESIKDVGVVQPVRVRPTEDGRFLLTAGERRLRAAKLAGLKKIPAVGGGDDPRGEAFHENHSRVDLNPIETALDIKAYAAEHGLSSIKEIAAKLNPEKPKLKVKWVGDHLRLLKLPPEVHPYIAEGVVPVAAEPKLRPVAAVSPGVAVGVCEVAKREELGSSRFVERFGDLLAQAEHLRIKDRPTMVSLTHGRLSDVVKAKKKREDLEGRILAVNPYPSEDPGVPFAEADVDAARAAGCLVEYGDPHGYYRRLWVTDRAFAEDLAERAVERMEQEAEDLLKRDAEEKAKRKDDNKKQREARKESGEESPQAKSKKRKEIARRFNDTLKRNVLKHRTKARRKQHALARSKAILMQLLEDNPELAAAGFRLASDSLQTVEHKTLKKGGSREIVTYASKEESTAELLRRVMAATDPLEVVEIGAEALMLGLLTDTEETPNKDSVRWFSRAGAKIEKLLKTEMKEIRPRRIPKPY